MLTDQKTQNFEVVMYYQSSTGWMFSENVTYLILVLKY